MQLDINTPATEGPLAGALAALADNATPCPIAALAAEAETIAGEIDALDADDIENFDRLFGRLARVQAAALKTPARSTAGLVFQLRALQAEVLSADGAIELVDPRVAELIALMDRGIDLVINALAGPPAASN